MAVIRKLTLENGGEMIRGQTGGLLLFYSVRYRCVTRVQRGQPPQGLNTIHHADNHMSGPENMDEPETYTLVVKSPLHIGNGRLLSPDEVVLEGDTVYVPDLNTYFEDHPDEFETFLQASGTDSGIGIDLPTTREYCRYTIAVPQGSEYDGRHAIDDGINTIVKDIRGRPYVPGSSIKGAIRTALTHRLLSQTMSTEQKDDLIDDFTHGDRDKVKIEELFTLGNSRGLSREQRDVLRWLSIGDSAPFDSESLSVRTADVYNQKSNGIQRMRWPATLETIEPGSEVGVEMSVDVVGLEKMVDGKEDAETVASLFGADWQEGQDAVLSTIETALSNFAEAIVEREISYFSDIDDIVQFYNQLPSGPRLRLGQSTGFHTVTALLGFEPAQQVGHELAMADGDNPEYNCATPPKHVSHPDFGSNSSTVTFVGSESDSDSNSESGSESDSVSASEFDTSSSSTKYSTGGSLSGSSSSSAESGNEAEKTPLKCGVCGEYLSVENGDVEPRFPRTRRVIHQYGTPTYPLGWVEIQEN
jgi:CRISPR-associated protein Csm5